MFWWLAGPISQEVGRTRRIAGRKEEGCFISKCFSLKSKWPKITIIFVCYACFKTKNQ